MKFSAIFSTRFQAPNPPQVTLTQHQMEYAAEYGLKRRRESGARGFREKFQDDGKGEERDIIAAQAELAVALFTHKAWNGKVGTFKGADVGDNIQVRYTHYPDGCLCARPRDNPSHLYILTTGTPPTFNIVGWLFGREIMHEDFLARDEDPPYYRAPQDKINLFKNDTNSQAPDAG